VARLQPGYDPVTVSDNLDTRASGRRGLGPPAAILYQGYQALVCFVFRHVVLHALFAEVEIYPAGRPPNIAEVRVGHLAGPVYDAAHDGYLDSLEVPCPQADPLRRRLQVEKRAAATRHATNSVLLTRAPAPCRTL